MEEKKRNHGPTEEELSDSVKDAYTSVYVLDPMAQDFDDEDDFQVEIVGAPSAVEAGGKSLNDSVTSAGDTGSDAVNGETIIPLSCAPESSSENNAPESSKETFVKPVLDSTVFDESTEQTQSEPAPETAGAFESTEQTQPEPAPETAGAFESTEQTQSEPTLETAGAFESTEQTQPEPAPETGGAFESAEQTQSEHAPETPGTAESAEQIGTAAASGAFGESRDESESSEEEPPKKKKGKAGLIIGLVLFLAVVSGGTFAYIHFRDHFTEHFYPGTVINGIDMSGMTIEDAKTAMQDMVDTYTLTISEKDNKKETIDAKSISLKYVDDGKIDDILEKQDAKMWFLFPFKKHIYSLKTAAKYTEKQLTEEIEGLSCLDESVVTAPQDAHLAVEGSTCTIEPEVEGNQVDKDKLVEAVTDAVDTNETEIDIVQDDCYLHPEVYRDDENLKSRMDQWNLLLSCNIKYWFGENVEVINADSLRDNIVDDGTNVSVPYEYVRKLVYGWGQKYDTFGLDRQFTTHSGETITVVNEGEGDYGWCSDKDKTIADVTEAINSGFQGDRSVVWLYEAMGWDNGDLTGTYVEVSLSEQKLWCYQDYNLVMETDVVTGMSTPERETKRGIYAIDAKKEHATLGTLDVQGYASPVDYWAPFNGGQGLHDAPWRSSFGGSIYQYNGSHGCVNIPPENMKPIFEAVSIGTAVVVY